MQLNNKLSLNMFVGTQVTQDFVLKFQFVKYYYPIQIHSTKKIIAVFLNNHQKQMCGFGNAD